MVGDRERERERGGGGCTKRKRVGEEQNKGQKG